MLPVTRTTLLYRGMVCDIDRGLGAYYDVVKPPGKLYMTQLRVSVFPTPHTLHPIFFFDGISPEKKIHYSPEQMSSSRVHDGSCHCGNVKYKIRLDDTPSTDPDFFAPGTRVSKCNCTTCHKVNKPDCQL
jgi:hypothetical protein